jgi:glycosyltransferase involved in cell wall biosynthesis
MEKPASPYKVAVAQLGARMHYAVPRILHEAGMLHRFYTDICAVKGWPRWLHMLPEELRVNGLKRLLSRVPDGVPRERIKAFANLGARYYWRRARAMSPTETTSAHLWAGRAFGERVIAEGREKADAVYTFNSAGLEILQYAGQNGIRGLVEQTIAPRRYERKLLEEEHARHPSWEPTARKDQRLPEFIEREHTEWECADTIVCGSPFVRDSVAACGGPVEKCTVVPYGVDARFRVPESRPHDGPLRVLTVGSVGLRKGAPYVLETAKCCEGGAAFRMVGSVDVTEAARLQLEKYVDVVGRVPRSEMPHQYEWADVFLLPSICEGSATVTYEALAAGLPVICTPNSGSIVRDEKEGFIVPIRDPEAIAECIHRLATDRQLRSTMSKNALVRYEEAGNLDAYADRLIKEISSPHGMLP